MEEWVVTLVVYRLEGELPPAWWDWNSLLDSPKNVRVLQESYLGEVEDES